MIGMLLDNNCLQLTELFVKQFHHMMFVLRIHICIFFQYCELVLDALQFHTLVKIHEFRRKTCGLHHLWLFEDFLITLENVALFEITQRLMSLNLFIEFVTVFLQLLKF